MGDLQSGCNLLKGLQVRDAVTVFHARDVVAKQSDPLCNVPLGEVLSRAECPQAKTDIH